ncbi:hypothetical protein D3C72_1798090 [compost metagenome]
MPGAKRPSLVSMKYSTSAEITGGIAIGNSTRPIRAVAHLERMYQMPRLKLAASRVAMRLVAKAMLRLWLMAWNQSGLLTSAS